MLTDEVRTFLKRHLVRLNTDAGQHFLIDEEVLADIVSAANLRATDRIVEIGPGIGVLTRELLKHAAHVTAIEIDGRLIPLLETFAYGNAERVTRNKLTIIHGNALHTPMPADNYKVVANIPYHITSPLLTHLLLESETIPESLTLLIQREVAENICAAGSESILAVLVKLFGKPTLVRLVPKESFLPPPEVDSAVLHIDIFKKQLVDLKTARRVLGLAKMAFSKRRKMLGNTIGHLPGAEAALKKANIDPKRRPQTLTTDEWTALLANIHPSE